MRGGLENWLLQRWYGGQSPGIGLRALAGVYRLLIARRKIIPVKLPIPVLVVGNFTAGGTGKTPLVIALAGYFAGKGLRPGIVSRGHGRKTDTPLRVERGTPVALCGDEPLLMHEKTGLPVLVDSDRVAAGRAAIDAGCGMIIADDGLQHHRLARDIEIEVLDGQRRYGNGLLLPAGPLREAPRPCDFRVINGPAAGDGEWAMDLELGEACNLADPGQTRPLADFVGSAVHAVAGIGNPARFFSQLRQVGLELIEHPFGDHHDFRPADFEAMRGPILMTEKDAVKCGQFGLQDAWSVPVEARLPAAFFAAVASRMEEKHVRA